MDILYECFVNYDRVLLRFFLPHFLFSTRIQHMHAYHLQWTW